MYINTFLLEVAKEFVLSFSDLKVKCFQNFFDKEHKLDSASVEDFKNFIKEHEMRVTPNSVILYLKSVETSHFREAVRQQLYSLKRDCQKNEKRICFSVNLLLAVLVVKGIVGFAFRK